MVITVPGRKPVCVLRRVNSQKSQQQSAVKKKGEQYFISLSIKLPRGVCDVFHSALQRLQESANLLCNCRDTCKISTFLSNLQALATLFPFRLELRCYLDNMISFFKGMGLNDLCYMAKETSIKHSSSIMHSSFSWESISIVDDVQGFTQIHWKIYSSGIQ